MSSSPEPPSGSITGILFIIIASLGFASKGIFIKLSYQISGNIDAITVMAVRMLIALPFFLATAIFLQRKPDQTPLQGRDYLHILYLGFMGYYLSSLLDISGLYHISAGLERLILYLYPTFVVLLSAYQAKRPVARHEISALLLSYIGIAMVFAFEIVQFGNTIVQGALLVLSAAFSFALFMVGSHGAVQRIGAARFTAYSMTVATLLTLIHYTILHGLALFDEPPGFYLYAVDLALLGTVVPAFLMNAGLHRVGASQTAILTSVGPILTLALAYVYLGEPLTLVQMAGTMLILAGVYVAGRRRARA